MRKKRTKKLLQDIFDKYDLNDTDKRVLGIKLKVPQAKSDEVAAHVGVSAARVRTIWSKPAFKDAINEYRAAWIDRLPSMQDEALRILQNYMRTGDPNLRVKVALEVCKAPGGALYDSKSREEDTGGMIAIDGPDGQRILTIGSKKLIEQDQKLVGPNVEEE